MAGTFLSNHDQPRIATQLKGDLEAAKRAAAVLLTAPGVPFIYYGEELGMTGTKPDEQIRTPFPWTADAPGFGFTSGTPWEPFSDGAATRNLATERADGDSVWSTYRNLVQLRVRDTALRAGGFLRVKASDPHVAAWLRDFGEEHVLVLHNLGDAAAAGVALDLADGRLCGSPTPSVLFSTAGAAAAPTAPVITATGGLDGYVPYAELPPRSSLVIDLSR
jgi:glycosidase